MRHPRKRLAIAVLGTAIIGGVLTPGVATAGTDRAMPSLTTTAVASGTADQAVAAARTQLGVPYVWGGTTSRGFDCSGLVQWAYRQAGVSLPRTSRAQSRVGTAVSVTQLRAGDLLFYNYGGGVSHVAMAVSGTQVIEASRAGKPVATRAVYKRGLVAVRRVG